MYCKICQLITSKKGTALPFNKKYLMNLNYHIDQLLPIFLKVFTKIKR